MTRINIPRSGRSIEVSKGGNNVLDGTTVEKPVLTINQGIANAVAINASNINVGDGDYNEVIEMPVGRDLRGAGATIRTSTPGTTAITGASSSVIDVHALSATDDNTIAWSINNRVRTELRAEVLIMGSLFSVEDNITCIDIQGLLNDEVIIKASNGENRATNSTLIKIAGNILTPPLIAIGAYTNFADGLTLVNHNPPNANQITTVHVFFCNSAVTAAIGLDLFKGNSGRLIINTSGIDAPGQQVATVGNGLTLEMLGTFINGNITVESGGEYVITALGKHNGNLTIDAAGKTTGDMVGHIGNLDIQGEFDGTYVKLDGDLTIGAAGVFEGSIDTITGTTTIDPAALAAGNVNGRINGTRYGRRLVDIEDTVTTETQVNKALRPNGLGGVEWIAPITTFGSAFLTGGAANTDYTQNVWRAIDSNNSFVLSGSNSGFILDDSDTGALELTDDSFIGTCVVTSSFDPTGSKTYEFRIAKDAGSGYVVLPENIVYQVNEGNSAPTTVTLNVPISMVVGDKVRIESRNIDGDDDAIWRTVTICMLPRSSLYP